MTPDQPLETVLAALAAAQPTPGGGAAAALAGALGASLAGMTARLAARDATGEAREGAARAVETADRLRGRLVALAAEDAAAYTAVMAAAPGPERAAAWREAIRVPAEVVKACREVALIGRRMAQEGRPTAGGDALMATLLAAAAAAGSQVNLRLNLAAAGRPEALRVMADNSELLLRDTQRAAAEARTWLEAALAAGRGGPASG